MEYIYARSIIEKMSRGEIPFDDDLYIEAVDILHLKTKNEDL